MAETKEDLKQRIEALENEILDQKGEIKKLGDDLYDEKNTSKGLLNRMEEMEEEAASFNGELTGFCEIRYYSNNLHDDAMLDTLGRILDSGFTTKDLNDFLELHFKDKIKTL